MAIRGADYWSIMKLECQLVQVIVSSVHIPVHIYVLREAGKYYFKDIVSGSISMNRIISIVL